jgi:hypothetical protein
MKHEDDVLKSQDITQEPGESVDPLEETLNELSIIELDERLEFVTWCDNCSC